MLGGQVVAKRSDATRDGMRCRRQNGECGDRYAPSLAKDLCLPGYYTACGPQAGWVQEVDAWCRCSSRCMVQVQQGVVQMSRRSTTQTRFREAGSWAWNGNPTGTRPRMVGTGLARPWDRGINRGMAMDDSRGIAMAGMVPKAGLIEMQMTA
ncbi:hypothetical protein CSOJ01_03981 [Colletotrichum sojae]|uniref:Uncharacterized protein n=1 Tax=Colletotrichum sojae TaxID=2175907 RepID=A0A8H6MZA4_9PEZI|nr:hypothetical protein CSOJ01_03981 [Colletotrichum sojae]